MKFQVTKRLVKTGKPPETFTEETAPDWITSANTIPGSTMDNRWFWKDHVLTLGVGESVNTDFDKITRIE